MQLGYAGSDHPPRARSAVRKVLINGSTRSMRRTYGEKCGFGQRTLPQGPITRHRRNDRHMATRYQAEQGEPGQIVDASLVITVLNEARSLPRFFESVARQRCVPEEIIIVDGGSTDGTVDVVRGWKPPGATRVRLIISSGANISTGRNIAIRNASHQYILVTDGGITLDPMWTHHLVTALASGTDVASGFFHSARTGTRMARIIGTIITPGLAEVKGSRFLPSSRSLGFSRSAWESVGGYPEWLDYCEDLVFDLEMKKAGMVFEFVPDATVTWDARGTIRAYAKQYYRYARGDGKAALWGKRHCIRYASYGSGLIMLGLATKEPRWLLVLCSGFAASCWKYKMRVARASSTLGRLTGPALAMIPLIVVVGDIAKMVGYPVGVLWRVRSRAIQERA